jgi:hypothetical protein
MLKQDHRTSQKPLWFRFISCAVFGFYLFALVAMPALDQLVFHHAVTCSEHSSDSDSTPVSDSENSCPICKFVQLAVPFFEVSDPLIGQWDTVSEVYLTVAIPSVAHAAALPACRAPPMFS